MGLIHIKIGMIFIKIHLVLAVVWLIAQKMKTICKLVVSTKVRLRTILAVRDTRIRNTNYISFSVFGEKLTKTLNGYLPEYKNLEYTITSLFTLGSLQLVAAILTCVIQNKVQHLRHMPFSTVY